MAVSCDLINLAQDLEHLKRLEDQIMDGSSMWICAYKKRLELGGDVPLESLRQFPEEFSELISVLQAEKRKIQKEGFLALKDKIRNKTLTFEDIFSASVLGDRFRIPEKIFLESFIIMFDKLENYSHITYKPIWKLFEYFNLVGVDNKYRDFGKYIFHLKQAKDKYDAWQEQEADKAMG